MDKTKSNDDISDGDIPETSITDIIGKPAAEQFLKIIQNDQKQNSQLSEMYLNKEEKYECFWPVQDRMRYLVALAGLLGLVLSAMSRTIFNVAITSMATTLPSNATSDDVCPSQLHVITDSSGETLSEDGQKQMHWKQEERDLLQSSFFMSYFVFMIPGGIISEVYGSKYVLFVAVFFSGIVNLVTPFIAENYALLVTSRLIAGVSQSAVFPAIYALVASWNTMTEANVMASLMKMGLRLGVLFGSLLPGLVTGWEPVFYITGGICIIWSIIWVILVTSEPEQNSFVSRAELYRIVRKKPARLRDSILSDLRQVRNEESGIKNVKPRSKASFETWKRIIFHPTVIGLILAKLFTNYTSDFLVTLLPIYIKDVFNSNKYQVTVVNVAVALVQVITSVFIGWLVKYAVTTRPFGMSLTGVRRFFQIFTTFGSTIGFILLSFHAGGESMIPLDVNEKYAATIMALANCFSNISSFSITSLKSLFLGDKPNSVSRWNQFGYSIGVINVIGGLVFWFMVKADYVDFDGSEGKDNHDEELADGIELKRRKTNEDQARIGEINQSQSLGGSPNNVAESEELSENGLDSGNQTTDEARDSFSSTSSIHQEESIKIELSEEEEPKSEESMVDNSIAEKEEKKTTNCTDEPTEGINNN